MTLFEQGAVSQIATDHPNLYAFRINGHLDDDASEALAKYMNDAFDTHAGKVNMLLDLSGLTSSEWDSILDAEVLKSRFRSLKEVDKYAVVGAPDRAKGMINFLDKVIPVQAKAFDESERQAAWEFVGEPRHAA